MSGALMLFTLGGLGVWVFIDFFYFFFMDYRDLKGYSVRSDYHKGLFVLIPLMLLITSACFLYPGYKSDALRGEEFTATVAALNLIQAEAAYKQATGFYSPSVETLETKFYLEHAPSIRYSDILLYETGGGRQCYRFELAHEKGRIGFVSDSCGATFRLKA
jgi:hypothetical protein